MTFLRKHASLILRIALSVGLVAFLLTKLDLHEMGRTFLEMNPWGWAIGFAVFALAQSIAALRWWSLARPLGFHDGIARFQRLYFEGLFFSLCLPSTIGGDVVKSIRASPHARGRMLAGFSAAVDRLCGLAAVLTIGLAALAAREWNFSPALAFAFGGGIFIVGSALLWGGLHFVGVLRRRLPHDHRLRRMLEPLVPYQDRPLTVVIGIVLSFGVQFLNVLCVLALGRAIGLDLPFGAYCVAVPLTALATTLPISLSGVGVREGAMVVLLAEYGVDAVQGAMLGLVWFSVQVATGLCGGVAYLVGPKLTYIDEDYHEALTAHGGKHAA